MSVSVTMPRLGESVTEGTVTRWLKAEGERIELDEPLLEVSTDKVDTEVPSPAAGILTSIKVAEDETVDIGVELAVIGEAADSSAAPEDQPTADAPTADAPTAGQAAPAEQVLQAAPPADAEPSSEPAASEQPAAESDAPAQTAADLAPVAPAEPAAPVAGTTPPAEPAEGEPAQAAGAAPAQAPPTQAPPAQAPPTRAPSVEASASPRPLPSQSASSQPDQQNRSDDDGTDDDEPAGAYVTPLVRKLATEHNVDLAKVRGTGVGGRIRKSDILAAAAAGSPSTSGPPAPAAPAPAPAAAVAAPAASAPAPVAAPAPPPAPVPSPGPTTAAERPAAATPVPPTVQPPAAAPLRGRTEKLSRRRALIAARMIESLQTSAQLTSVVEVDVTRIARLRAAAKQDFEAREGVKLSFLPFFALAAVEALRIHPNINASIDTAAGTVTYHDEVNLGLAVDTESGLVVPVIQRADDLNLGGLARKIADLAGRTRANKIGPDELSGATFSLTNTGSRGALFDTPIFTPPQVAILGTGAVVKRAVVVSDPNIGETIAVRSMVYLALSYDHQIVDGADAARFLSTIKERLDAGAFEGALGLG